MYTFKAFLNLYPFSQAGKLPKYSLFLKMNNSLYLPLLLEVSTDFGRLNTQDFRGIKLSCANLRQSAQKEVYCNK